MSFATTILDALRDPPAPDPCPVAFGACCDLTGGDCMDEVAEPDCDEETMAFSPDQTCAEVACEPSACTGDVNGDGIVGIDDLVLVILAWGECSGDCPADVDGDGHTGVGDLIAVVLNWGPC